MCSLSATPVAPRAVIAGRSRTNSSPPSRATVSNSCRMPWRRGQLKQYVTAGVAKGSVDLLEAVKIHEQEGQGTASTAGSENDLLLTVVEQGAVEQSGQGACRAWYASTSSAGARDRLADGARFIEHQAKRRSCARKGVCHHDRAGEAAVGRAPTSSAPSVFQRSAITLRCYQSDRVRTGGSTIACVGYTAWPNGSSCGARGCSCCFTCSGVHRALCGWRLVLSFGAKIARWHA